MEGSVVDDDSDPPLIVVSGIESFTESPTYEIPENSTICDIDLKNANKRVKLKNILDKSISIDDDSLVTPLKPIQCNPNGFENNQELMSEGHSSEEETLLPSILRKPSCFCVDNKEPSRDSDDFSLGLRRVSFPSDETILASYKEPESPCPWIISRILTPEEIIHEYQQSCKRHQTIELDVLKNQILEIKNNTNRSATLNLGSISISTEVCETLEDLFKIVNFRKIILSDCKFTADTIQEFLNMLEYYESVRELEISEIFYDIDTWKIFCNVIAKSVFLESVIFKHMSITEPYTRLFVNALRNNANVTTLKFDGCGLVKLPSFYLVENLMFNNKISELYLSQTGLYTKEADCLGRFLSKNMHLKVLDISNNYIGDRGLEVLAKGLTKQKIEGTGLSVLIIFNNQLTEKSGPIISNIIEHCHNLHTLNVGYNNLTDEVIVCIQNSLTMTKSLEGLGLQSTLLTCKGADYLAQSIQNNTSLQKINLKGNKAIQINGLEKLCLALTNSKITRIEIDETNRSCNDPQAYIEIAKKINGICTINKSIVEQSVDEEIINISRMISRKVSLSCEPCYLTPQFPTDSSTGARLKSPMPSPNSSQASSPTSRSRFQVFKVQDANQKAVTLPSSPGSSRFKVIRVTTSPVADSLTQTSSSPDEDEETTRRFVNVRSSMSSTESIESFTKCDDSSAPNENSD